MIRHSIISLDYLKILKNDIRENKENKYQIINGVSVKIVSQRYAVFKKSIVCVDCGIVGSFLALEKDNNINPEPQHYHLNLYAIDENGDEMLMTKDHIQPKSKGGRNHTSNYQTMCSKCNAKKGNGDS